MTETLNETPPEPTEPEPTEPEPEPGEPTEPAPGEHGDAEPTNGDEPEPEPGDEPEPEAAQNALDLAMVDKLERENKRYHTAVRKIVGEAVPIFECLTCQGTGIMFEPTEVPTELLPDKTRERCPDCDGNGKVKTGSRVETEAVLACPTCNGAGWRNVLYAVQPVQVPQGQPGTPGWMGTVTPSA